MEEQKSQGIQSGEWRTQRSFVSGFSYRIDHGRTEKPGHRIWGVENPEIICVKDVFAAQSRETVTSKKYSKPGHPICRAKSPKIICGQDASTAYTRELLKSIQGNQM